uniref:Predicted protein n=1 Tax=Hordeum vulgare subsp. vulgare TaxID=112509 RepID=F2DVQ8_HORVV|nr:predicted protein [Hordeum vulgare subsp. vulgare]
MCVIALENITPMMCGYYLMPRLPRWTGQPGRKVCRGKYETMELTSRRDESDTLKPLESTINGVLSVRHLTFRVATCLPEREYGLVGRNPISMCTPRRRAGMKVPLSWNNASHLVRGHGCFRPWTERGGPSPWSAQYKLDPMLFEDVGLPVL